jgi:hypothetical protein
MIFISGQSKNTADCVLTEILENQEILKKMKQKLVHARNMLEQKAGSGTAEEPPADAETKSVKQVIVLLEEIISEKTSTLGFTETPKGGLWKLKGDTFLCL